MRNRIAVILMAIAMLGLGGCATLHGRREHSSSLVKFLYPEGQKRPLQAETVHLTLPVKVGLVFVPNNTSYDFSRGPLPTGEQVKLLDRVAEHFRQYRFVDKVEVIPSNYVAAGGGFANLDALANMYDVDILGLVSYDQVQNTDEGALSFLYWTIVGAYTVPAERNVTTTFVDTAVFDLKSRKLLFRAPGISRDKRHSTAINNPEALREASQSGFDTAFDQMIVNLDQSLAGFKDKVRDQPEHYKVSYAKGYGGGATGPWLLLGLAGILVWRCMRVCKPGPAL